MSNLEEKAKRAFELKTKYARMYDNDEPGAEKVELEYIELRREVLKEITAEATRQRSEIMTTVKDRVYKKEKPERIETGIRVLDEELVTEDMRMRGVRGGLSLGNFIQIAGSRGAGKSSLMLKILTGLSQYESVSWFDFEMGEDRVVSKLRSFRHKADRIYYYTSSRNIDDVTDEIKFLNAVGVNHFVIDSAMKINVPGVDRYEKFSTISGRLSELTSAHGINIYMINQMSQSAEREGHLSIKHGNDAEYDADFIFYLVNAIEKDDNGKFKKDDAGQTIKDTNKRILICEKNRQDDRLFSVEISKTAIFDPGVESE